ncbi:hypothetical protein HanPI659440_Chr14g0549551 [Helianthus annuus]|nr:hypothetical protein HanPI659440_Chr14g0549551 [Helianthus annuus]
MVGLTRHIALKIIHFDVLIYLSPTLPIFHMYLILSFCQMNFCDVVDLCLRTLSHQRTLLIH